MENDQSTFDNFADQRKQSLHLKKLCKQTLKGFPFKRLHSDLKNQSKLLPWYVTILIIIAIIYTTCI